MSEVLLYLLLYVKEVSEVQLLDSLLAELHHQYQDSQAYT